MPADSFTHTSSSGMERRKLGEEKSESQDEKKAITEEEKRGANWSTDERGQFTKKLKTSSEKRARRARTQDKVWTSTTWEL